MFVLLYVLVFCCLAISMGLAISYITKLITGKDSEETLEKYKELLERKSEDCDTELNLEDELNSEDSTKTTYL